MRSLQRTCSALRVGTSSQLSAIRHPPNFQSCRVSHHQPIFTAFPSPTPPHKGEGLARRSPLRFIFFRFSVFPFFQSPVFSSPVPSLQFYSSPYSQFSGSLAPLCHLDRKALPNGCHLSGDGAAPANPSPLWGGCPEGAGGVFVAAPSPLSVMPGLIRHPVTRSPSRGEMSCHE
jgi:hypothetical protein